MDANRLVGSNRPPISVNDTVTAPLGATKNRVSLAELSANDVQLDGSSFLLGFVPTSNPPITIVLSNNYPGSFDPAEYPEGYLEFTLEAPLTSDLAFDYNQLNAPGGIYGNSASFTVRPQAPHAAQDDGPLLDTIGRYGFITGNRLLANDAGTAPACESSPCWTTAAPPMSATT